MSQASELEKRIIFVCVTRLGARCSDLALSLGWPRHRVRRVAYRMGLRFATVGRAPKTQERLAA